MCNDTDTRVIDRKPRRLFNPAPLCVAIVVIVVALIAAAALGKAGRMKKAGVMVMEAAHDSRYPERVTAVPTPVKALPKLNHVIFRLGGDEIFRFTHEDTGKGLRYSFEIREGGA